jgi:phage regulator Rha-like protein
MKITITNVLKNEVTVSGQTMSREYVENIMLPMLVAQCATVISHKFEIVKAFDEAGLSLAAIPEVAREYRQDQHAKAAERARQQREANAHAERLREATPRELAQAKADREARAAAIREQGDRVRAASRNSGW